LFLFNRNSTLPNFKTTPLYFPEIYFSAVILPPQLLPILALIHSYAKGVLNSENKSALFLLDFFEFPSNDSPSPIFKGLRKNFTILQALFYFRSFLKLCYRRLGSISPF